MKRFFTVIMAALLVAPFLQSCNTADTEQPQNMVLASVIPYMYSNAGFACLLDNDQTIYPGRVRINYEVNQDMVQRAIIYFSELNEPVQGFTYNADIFNIVNVTTKEIEILSDPAVDTLTTPLQVNQIVLGGNYFNVDFSAKIDPYATKQYVTISLIDNQISGKPEYGEYYPLELKLKCTPDVEGKGGQLVNSMACFAVGNLDSNTLKRLGCKGYKITYKDINSDTGDTKSIIIPVN